MSLEILIPKGYAKTSEILVEHLEDLGVDVKAHYTYKGNAPRNPTARVCWGMGSWDRLPTLNAKAGRLGKYEQMRKLSEAGVRGPRFWRDVPDGQGRGIYPILARLNTHEAGTDIVVCEDWRQASNTRADFFVQVVPSVTEFRVWVANRDCLGVYERQRVWPIKKQGFGRNWWNGYGYVRLEDGERDLKTIAVDAVKALGYDFGAVDVLLGEDHRFYVLEVNSAPGVESKEQLALKKLAQKIANWYGRL